MLLSASGVRILILLTQRLASSLSRRLRNQKSIAQAGDRADADILGDRPQRKDAVRLAVAGNQRHRRGNLDAAACARVAASNICKKQPRLAMSGQAGQADDLALMRDEFGTVGLPAPAWPGHAAAVRP